MNIKFLSAVAVLAIGFASEAAFADDAAAPAAAAAPTPEFTVTGAAEIVSAVSSSAGLTSVGQQACRTGNVYGQRQVGLLHLVLGLQRFRQSRRFCNGNFYTSPNNGTEIDVYGGYTHTFAKSGITVDGGLYGYIYPNRDGQQPVRSLWRRQSKAYGPITLKVGVNWAPKQNYFKLLGPGVTQYNMYEYGNISYTPVKVPALTFHGELGHTGGGLKTFVKEYIDYTVGVGYKWKALTFDISGSRHQHLSHGDAQPLSDGDRQLRRRLDVQSHTCQQQLLSLRQAGCRWHRSPPASELTDHQIVTEEAGIARFRPLAFIGQRSEVSDQRSENSSDF